MVKHVHTPARKVRLVADLIRGKSVEEAKEILAFTQRPSATPHVLKALKAAEAAASERVGETGELIVEEIIVNDAPMMKRIRPASMGRAVRVRKRQCHIYIALTQ
ncbi:MAG: 50S ribosomal protein L22 [Candidatus Sumerlaeia bacterium]|nr:50S ribosomal protein L22 [Candidatus Sumerlaeia bacterium]